MKNVLIVESDRWLLDHYRRTLEEAGFAVRCVSNAFSAIEHVEEKLPDVVVLNLTLSGASSIALLHELQAFVDTGEVPVIVCSSLHDIDDTDLKPYGVRRILDTKSMQVDDLARVVRSVTA